MASVRHLKWSVCTSQCILCISSPMENLEPKMEIEHALDMHYCPWKNLVSSCISSPPLLKWWWWWDFSLGWLLDAEADHSFTVILISSIIYSWILHKALSWLYLRYQAISS